MSRTRTERGPKHGPGCVGVIANPMAGRDVRRLMGRALQQTPEMKRNQIQRAVVGAVAAGARRVLLMRDCFRTAEGAVEGLRLHADIELLAGAIATRPDDTHRAAERMRAAGCGALIVLGGDGTNREIARAWPDAVVVPISTGTNNVFPAPLEATTAGAAAGLLASGAVTAAEAAPRAKRIEAEHPDGGGDLALVDAVLLEGDHPGSLLHFDPERLRALVLTRAEPASIGTSPIGGLLHPTGADDDRGVEVRCAAAGTAGTRPLLAPISPGLYGTAHIASSRPLPLGEWTELPGPGVVAYDGDRSLRLPAGACVRVRVTRTGPHVVDVPAALTRAAELGVFHARPDWHDAAAGGGFDCC